MIVSLLTLGLLLIPSSNAFWRMPCTKSVLDSRVDPIVAPGKPSGHAHTIMGSNAIGLSTTFDDLRASDCTTCMVNDDRSAYWIPELYYQYKNGSFAVVSHGGMTVYYLQRNAANETVEPFPDGLRMLTGDPNIRNNTGSPESKAISWLCLNFNGPGEPQTPGFTNTNCPNGLRAQVFFPGCWDGKNLDSPDHKSHMAYPDGVDNGQCPYTHPHHLMSIFYEVMFSVDPFNKLNDGGRFVLANGDSTGYGLHGDFLDGWDKSVLSRAIQTCTANSGVIEDCPVFKNEGRLLPDTTTNSCSAPNPIPSENVLGLIPNLPGCVAVTNGPAPATGNLVPGCVPGAANPVPVSGQSKTTSTSMSMSLSVGMSVGMGMSMSMSSSSSWMSTSTPPAVNTPPPALNADPTSSMTTSAAPSGTPSKGSPAPSSPPSGDEEEPENGSTSTSPSSSPASGGPATTDKSMPQPTSLPFKVPVHPHSSSSSKPEPTKHDHHDPPKSHRPQEHGHHPQEQHDQHDPHRYHRPQHGHHSQHDNHSEQHGHYSQPQEQQDDSEDIEYCHELPPPTTKKAKHPAIMPMRRRHHARRAGHGSYMHL